MKIALYFFLLMFCSPVTAQEVTFAVRQLTPEAALRLAQAAMQTCQKQGFQVAVAVSDRAGILQVLLRDRFAGPHTVDVASNKAWTAASFRQDTLTLSRVTAEPLTGGQRHFPRFVAVGGGLPIVAGGALVGAIGVSGAPGGEADEGCARAATNLIQDELDF